MQKLKEVLSNLKEKVKSRCSLVGQIFYNILVVVLIAIIVLGMISAATSLVSGVVYAIYNWGGQGMELSKALWEGTKLFLYMLLGGLGTVIVSFVTGLLVGFNSLARLKGK